MSERKIRRDGAAAVASVQIGQIDPSVRRGDFGISEVKLGLSSAEIPQIDTPRVATRNGVEYCGVGYTMVADVRKGASARNGQMDSPRVATRNGVEYCGVGYTMVAAQRAKASGEIPQIAPSRVATRNGVEYCGVDHKTVAAQRAKASTGEIPQSTLRTGADGRTMVSGIRAKVSGAKVSHLNDGPRLDRKIAEHCGVHHDTVASARAKASAGENPHLNDEPRLGRDGATP